MADVLEALAREDVQGLLASLARAAVEDYGAAVGQVGYAFEGVQRHEHAAGYVGLVVLAGRAHVDEDDALLFREHCLELVRRYPAAFGGSGGREGREHDR